MDVPLYAIALATFAVLYLALTVYLGVTILICLFVMLAYLAARHGKLPENYPHGLSDTLITVTFIGVTWGIFTWLGPKDPIPFTGSGLTYQPGLAIPLSAIITTSIIIAVAFLVVFSFIARDMSGGGGGGAPPGAESKPKQGVGA